MKNTLGKEEMIVNIPYENYFWLHNGGALKNLHELSEALKVMPKETFEHHVREDNNDFSNWIKDVFKEESLSKQIRKLKDGVAMAKAIEKRIQDEARMAGRPQKKVVLGQLREAFSHA